MIIFEWVTFHGISPKKSKRNQKIFWLKKISISIQESDYLITISSLKKNITIELNNPSIDHSKQTNNQHKHDDQSLSPKKKISKQNNNKNINLKSIPEN